MKKYFVLLLCGILLLSGCSANHNNEATIPQMSPEETPAAVLEPSVDEITESPDSEQNIIEMLSVSVPASTEHYALDDGTELFSYTTQHMELILPNETVADKVILDFLNRVDAAQLDAESILNAAQNNYDPTTTWYPYFYQVLYSPTRIDHGVLSLFGTQNSYSGATHGSLSCVSANYDLTTGDVLTLGSIMHMDAEKEAIIQLVMQKLDAQAEEFQLFDGFESGVRSRLGGDENLYEDFYFTTTGLSFFFAPYEIAPYAAGVITVEIPYNELTGWLYDGYFPAERDQNEGKMHTATFMETDMEQFNSMAEVTLSAGEDIMVIYPDGNVKDVRITVPGGGKELPDYTVFAALEMSEKNAIVLSVNNEIMNNVEITYMSNGNVETIPLI